MLAQQARPQPERTSESQEGDNASARPPATASSGTGARRRSREAEAEDEHFAWMLQQQMDDEVRQEHVAWQRRASAQQHSGGGRGRRGHAQSASSAEPVGGAQRGLWTSFVDQVARVHRACSCCNPPVLEDAEHLEQPFVAEPASPEEIFNACTELLTHEEMEEDPSEAALCGVCLQDYLAGEEVRVLPCAHRFHRECIDKWLHKRLACPTCKASIMAA